MGRSTAKPARAQPAQKKRSRARADAEEAPAPEPVAQQEAAPAPAEPPPQKRQRVARVSKPAPALFPPSKSFDLFTFGSNPFGALGLGEDTVLKGRPAQVEVEDEEGRPVQFAQVECGGMHTVALSSHGVVYTWGVNDEGALGRKTLGTAWEEFPDDDSKLDATVPGPAELPDNVRAVSVAAGDGVSFALGTDGAIYGCGEFKDDVGGINGFTPTIKRQRTFMLLWSPPSSRDHVRVLVAGGRHAAALTARGEVLTWGIGSQGQLGRVPAFDQFTPPQPADVFGPLPVPGLTAILGSSPIVNIACGAYTTFAISKAGDVAGWGLNNSSQLGLVKQSEDDNLKWQPQAIDSQYVRKIKSIAGGEQHTLALTKAGVLLSFGAGTYGMLGRPDIDVTTANELHPHAQPIAIEVAATTDASGQEVPAKPMPPVISMAAGMNVSACLSNEHIAFFWGSNTNSQLAKGTEDDEDEVLPLRMRRAATFGLRKIHQLSFGGQHAALLAGPKPEPAAKAPPLPSATAAVSTEVGNVNGASTSMAI